MFVWLLEGLMLDMLLLMSLGVDFALEVDVRTSRYDVVDLSVAEGSRYLIEHDAVGNVLRIVSSINFAVDWEFVFVVEMFHFP